MISKHDKHFCELAEKPPIPANPDSREAAKIAKKSKNGFYFFRAFAPSRFRGFNAQLKEKLVA